MKSQNVNIAFRVFEEGDVIAIFVDERHGDNCQSYQHIGQHAECSTYLLDELAPATADEYIPLLNEMESIGYEVNVVD